jgi:hypothetical protein
MLVAFKLLNRDDFGAVDERTVKKQNNAENWVSD